VLSGVITKAGVLAVIRVIYFLVGANTIRGTWVQTGFMTLALITVFMGSMLAYREPLLKKRLAYSTVSQVSYVLFGLSCLHPVAFAGAILHVIAHSLIKNGLFLCAGAIIHQTHKTYVRDLRGVGKQMPITIWCWTIASLGLIGIPPTGGFVSKWQLATGAMQAGIGAFGVVGPIVLIISALLTAAYLLQLTINGFFPGSDFDYSTLENKEPGKLMTMPMIALAVGVVLCGMLAQPLTNAAMAVVATIL
jgi:multicomponent Na+:H+ antiporter subunit D